MCCCCSAIVYNVLARSLLLLLVPLLFALVCGPSSSSMCHRTTPMWDCAYVYACAYVSVLMFSYLWTCPLCLHTNTYVRVEVSVRTVVDKRDFNFICVTSFGRWFYELCTAFHCRCSLRSQSLISFDIPIISLTRTQAIPLFQTEYSSLFLLFTICNACFDFSTLCVIVGCCVYYFVSHWFVLRIRSPLACLYGSDFQLA